MKEHAYLTVLATAILVVAGAGPTAVPQPTSVPQATSVPLSTAAPKPTFIPQPISAPKPTSLPQETSAPQATALPRQTSAPNPTSVSAPGPRQTSNTLPPECGSQCRFTFCPRQGPLTINIPDIAITTPICDKDSRVFVGNVGSTGEALVFNPSNGGYLRISQYSPPGLLQGFSRSFWKSYSLYYFHQNIYQNLSGVGHETPQLNQADFLHGQCFVLPLTAYQLLGSPGGFVVGNVHPIDPFLDCVAFTVI